MRKDALSREADISFAPRPTKDLGIWRVVILIEDENTRLSSGRHREDYTAFRNGSAILAISWLPIARQPRPGGNGQVTLLANARPFCEKCGLTAYARCAGCDEVCGRSTSGA